MPKNSRSLLKAVSILMIFLGIPLAVWCIGLVNQATATYRYAGIGCFLAGCCYGIPYNGVFSVQFPFLPERVLPVQLFEAVIEFFLCALFIILSLKRKTGLTELYILFYAPFRFLLEFLRGDEIRGKLWILSTSQWISLLLIFIVCLVRVKKLRRS